MSNILSEVHPELVAEWSDKNLPLTPDRITYGSNKVVWWKGACGHEWQTSVKARSNGENCPICSGARVIEGINDLATLKPELADEWSSKNDPLKPTMVTTGSHKKVIWQDKYGHEWTATVKSRALNGTGCPYCSHNKVLVGFNDLASQRPQIASEWSERNYPLKPDMVTVFANRKVWWRCSKGHEWNTLISTRSGGSGCPYCSGQLLLKGFNDFATTHPQLAQEWSDRNLPFTPDMINEKSRRNVWWKCRECGYEWQSVVYARVKGTVCPVCADRAVMEGYNDLATTDAHLLPEWDYEKNKDISPNKISRHSMQSVWWKCSLGHSWKAKISEKAIEGKGCKVCEKDYLTVFPKLAVMYYAAKKRIKVQTDTDKIIGIPLEIYSMQDSKIYGVEIDKISAGIAQQLYQKTSIAAQPFEEANIPDSFFDAVIGNVPFGDIRVNDRRYNKHNFLIHDYFFAKSLDKLRPGGVMALITSKGTMDKENPAVRKYIAQRADLLGAIRLPNNTFKGNAGTEVVSDILILQKRDRLIDLEPEWVHLNTDENGVKMNAYFVDHPEMVLGEWKTVSGRFGEEDTVVPYENADLAELLDEAISNIHAEITDYEVDEELTEEDNSIPADPEVRNFSYTVVDDIIYYRENSRMTPVECSATAENRIKGMIAIRDSVRSLIEMQTADYPDYEVEKEQQKLNALYDTFSKKYGLINSRANVSAFSQDSSFALLSALEVLDENGELERKADMFTKRTIKPHTPVTSVDTASEALAVSMGEKAYVDMEYMCSLTGKTEQEIYEELKGVIFLNPMYGYGNSTERKYLMADEYLSGNVREKLAWAKKSAEVYPEDYKINVEALEKVQPKDLTASEIFVQLGTTWLPEEIAQQFMYEFLDTPVYARWNIKVHYSKLTGEWNVEGKSYDRGNLKAYNTYGTKRVNAYKIIEDTLNMKDVRVFDYMEDDEGKKKAVLNKKETAIAQSKQELIKQGFQDWVWRDPARREKLVRLYNDKFNSIRPREYDGSHIIFSGMNPEIELREHQKNAVAHILYGGNTLLAHAVGAGKTFEMTAAAMESKRLGLCNKSLFVVPNHLTEQWAAEFLQLYPAANILVATKKDFEMKNRKRFCGRIATGDYDAVIIGHSQFEKIPISIERQRAVLQQQLDDIIEGIADIKRNRGDRFSVKQLEKTKKSLQTKLEKLNDQSRKDDVVTFEELGIDRLFIDESHYYKNRAKRCA